VLVKREADTWQAWSEVDFKQVVEGHQLVEKGEVLAAAADPQRNGKGRPPARSSKGGRKHPSCRGLELMRKKKSNEGRTEGTTIFAPFIFCSLLRPLHRAKESIPLLPFIDDGESASASSILVIVEKGGILTATARRKGGILTATVRQEKDESAFHRWRSLKKWGEGDSAVSRWSKKGRGRPCSKKGGVAMVKKRACRLLKK
jgi:hypothetical protein